MNEVVEPGDGRNPNAIKKGHPPVWMWGIAFL
jgi:hypothetical protein